MLRRILIAWIILAVAIALAAWLIPGIVVHGGFLGLIGLAALYGLVNALIGTVLRLLTLPLTIITLGLSTILVNALLLAITAWLTTWLDVGGFWPAVGAAIVISLVSSLLHLIFLRKKV